MLSDHYIIDCKPLITKASFLISKKYLFEKQVPCEQAYRHGRERFAITGNFKCFLKNVKLT